jgi:hypothetical protein
MVGLRAYPRSDCRRSLKAQAIARIARRAFAWRGCTPTSGARGDRLALHHLVGSHQHCVRSFRQRLMEYTTCSPWQEAAPVVHTDLPRQIPRGESARCSTFGGGAGRACPAAGKYVAISSARSRPWRRGMARILLATDVAPVKKPRLRGVVSISYRAGLAFGEEPWKWRSGCSAALPAHRR